jgi:hypothetical protein
MKNSNWSGVGVDEEIERAAKNPNGLEFFDVLFREAPWKEVNTHLEQFGSTLKKYRGRAGETFLHHMGRMNPSMLVTYMQSRHDTDESMWRVKDVLGRTFEHYLFMPSGVAAQMDSGGLSIAGAKRLREKRESLGMCMEEKEECVVWHHAWWSNGPWRDTYCQINEDTKTDKRLKVFTKKERGFMKELTTPEWAMLLNAHTDFLRERTFKYVDFAWSPLAQAFDTCRNEVGKHRLLEDLKAEKSLSSDVRNLLLTWAFTRQLHAYATASDAGWKASGMEVAMSDIKKDILNWDAAGADWRRLTKVEIPRIREQGSSVYDWLIYLDEYLTQDAPLRQVMAEIDMELDRKDLVGMVNQGLAVEGKVKVKARQL